MTIRIIPPCLIGHGNAGEEHDLTESLAGIGEHCEWGKKYLVELFVASQSNEKD